MKGAFTPGTTVAGRSPISAVAFGGGWIQVYWRNIQGDILVSKDTGSWGLATKVLGGFGSGFQFAVVQWEKGAYVRLYYQDNAGLVREYCGNDNGGSWSSGELQVGGIIE